MDKETLYWVLSTLPQVSAALVAFIGFLALQSLDEPRRRRVQLEESCRRELQDWTRNFKIGNFAGRDWFEIEAMPAETFMENVGWFLENPDQDVVNRSNMVQILGNYYRVWKILDRQIGKTHKVLTIFVSFHLLVIGGTLSLIPYIPRLAAYPWIEEAVVATALLMVVTVAIMIFAALHPFTKKN